MEEQNIFKSLLLFLTESDLLPVLLGAFLALFLLSRDFFRDALINVSKILRMSGLFYRDIFDIGIRDNTRMRQLEKDLARIQKEISNTVLKDSTELIKSELELFLTNNLEALTIAKLEDTGAIENQLFKDLEDKTNSRIDSYLKSKALDEFTNSKKEREFENVKTKIRMDLFNTVEHERRSAGLLKSVMINLFIIVNFAFLFFLFFGSAELTQNTALTMSGLYISLAGFIIYIFRASNARTSVLLAIKEDNAKQMQALDYAKLVCSERALGDQDTEFIRLMMINHAEREQKIDHPYEMVFKGVSDTNIQFKGGKMAIGKKSN